MSLSENITGPAGFEPATTRLRAGRSTVLSYGPMLRLSTPLLKGLFLIELKEKFKVMGRELELYVPLGSRCPRHCLILTGLNFIPYLTTPSSSYIFLKVASTSIPILTSSGLHSVS